MDPQAFIQGAQNITSESEIITYASKELFLPSIIFIYVVVVVLMGLLGVAITDSRSKSNFYAIFGISVLVMGILLCFTFYFPIIPQFIDKLLGGKI